MWQSKIKTGRLSVSWRAFPLVHRGLSLLCPYFLVEGAESFPLGSLVKALNLSWELFALMTYSLFKTVSPNTIMLGIRFQCEFCGGHSIESIAPGLGNLHSAGKIQPPAYFVNFYCNTAILVYIAYDGFYAALVELSRCLVCKTGYLLSGHESTKSLRLLKTPLLFLPDWVTNHVNFLN